MTKILKSPLIKWSGSKRKQAPYIVSQMPDEIDTYYECFLGGGSVLHELLNQISLGNKKVKRIVCCDLNTDLINIWNTFTYNRQKLYDEYVKHYNNIVKRSQVKEGEELNRTHVANAQTYFYEMREKMNTMSVDDPERTYLFYWISRTSFNGLVRYNPNKGDLKHPFFNASFHVGGRMGIKPNELLTVFESWGSVIDSFIESGGEIKFINDTYTNVIEDAKEGDLIYMDPPYVNTTGMYFCESFSEDDLWNELRRLNINNVKWLLSYDGITGKDNRTANVPEDLYIRHEYVNAGHSSFKKLKSKSVEALADKNKDVVKDSLYINYD